MRFRDKEVAESSSYITQCSVLIPLASQALQDQDPVRAFRTLDSGNDSSEDRWKGRRHKKMLRESRERRKGWSTLEFPPRNTKKWNLYSAEFLPTSHPKYLRLSLEQWHGDAGRGEAGPRGTAPSPPAAARAFPRLSGAGAQAT